MKIACIGGGPAGLYLGILIRKVAPEHEVVVFERNRPDDTFGFGVVFSDATLGQLAAADPVSHASITKAFARWDDIEIHHAGEVLRSTGHGFCGLERKRLLQILQARAAELGVVTHFEHPLTSLDDPALADANLIVGADGVGSWVRDALAADFKPAVDVRPNKFVWLGTTVPYQAFTFVFTPSKYGLFRVHAYRFKEGESTFIAECTEATWRAAGLDRADEDQTIAILSEVFADHLMFHKLIKNRSIWRNFPTVRCGSWRSRHRGRDVVLVGDAAHTAHFSIGSGTKLAMEDAITLRDALMIAPKDIAGALATYEGRRRPEVESLQAAAQASLSWFEHTERYLELPTQQFAYHLMTRSLRVSHASVARRDPSLAWSVEMMLAGRVGIVPDPDETRPLRPTALPLVVPTLHLVNRIAVVAGKPSVTDGLAGDEHLVELGACSRSGASLVVTHVGQPGGADIVTDEQTVAWRRIVDFVHGRSVAKIAALVRLDQDRARLANQLRRLAFAGFDLVIADLGDGATADQVGRIHDDWPHDRAFGIQLAARDPDALIAAVTRARHERPALVWVASTGDDHAAVLLADRVRFELGLVTAIGLHNYAAVDRDAIIASGRADLIVAVRLPDEQRRP